MNKLKKRNNKKLLDRPPKVGEEVVTETAVVYSNATVVWQDGSIETGISSRELYPIHHLDEHVRLALFSLFPFFMFFLFLGIFSWRFCAGWY